MFDFREAKTTALYSGDIDIAKSDNLNVSFTIGKRLFDILASIVLLPTLVAATIVLLVLNPFLNKGKLLFFQVRMGKDCRAFVAYKFRTMSEVSKISRGADDPLEHDRISRFGRLLRKTRVDELPQLINVLKGDMSLIGPRPDFFHHARRYVRQVPGYRNRHSVRPGISGLAQTEIGYVEGAEATAAKVRADIYYINNASIKLDAWIFYRTLVTVFLHKGA